MKKSLITGLSAVTMATTDMPRSVRFYESLGFKIKLGGPNSPFTSYWAGDSTYLNIANQKDKPNWTGRIIIYVADVDQIYQQCLDSGLKPEFAPSDAFWGERYFHIHDPDGNELSFAKPLPPERTPEMPERWKKVLEGSGDAKTRL
eukprot:Clim_evm1s197 gene=Clim_evmTU1s197